MSRVAVSGGLLDVETAVTSPHLPTNPHRLDGELAAPYEGYRSAHLGTYRVVYRIDEGLSTIYVLAVRLCGDVYGTR